MGNIAARNFYNFCKMSFLKVPKVLLRVLDSTQIVLWISPNTFRSEIKAQKTIAPQSFQEKI